MAVRGVEVAPLTVAFRPPFNLLLKGNFAVYAAVEAADERTPCLSVSIHV
jgi:hypothetical protein